MEGEASWRRTDLGSIKYDKLTVDGDELDSRFVDAINANIDVKGTRSTLSLMANAWYDVDIGLASLPTSAAASGSGTSGTTWICRSTCHGYRSFLPLRPNSSTASAVTTATGCSPIRVGGGVGYRLMESLVVHVGYRYMGAGDPKLNWLNGHAVKSDVGNHVFRAGVRIGF